MRFFLLFLFLVSCSDSKAPVDYFAVETPRPFGYVLGDEITQRIILDTRPDVQLQTASLPNKGQLNRWLNLNAVSIKQSDQHYEIELVYQVFYATLEVKALKIPGFNLQLSEVGQTSNQAVPAWEFTISPLRELSVRKTEQGEYMRPDAMPGLLSSPLLWYGFFAGLLVLLSTAIYLAYLYGYFPTFIRRLLFTRALRQLAKLSLDQMGQALTIVHHTLNTLNRQPLFQNQLKDFYQRNPPYRGVNAELEWFFQLSNQYFFAKNFNPRAEDFEKITTFCHHCRQIERGSR